MDKEFDTTYTGCNLQTFKQVESVISKYRGQELITKLEALFESGVPANGYHVKKGYPHLTYLTPALAYNNQDALAYLLKLNYEDMNKAGCKFTNYLAIPQARQILLDAGHSFAREIEDPLENFWSKVSGLGLDFFKTIASRGARFDIPIMMGEVATPPIIQSATYGIGTELVQTLLSCGVDPRSSLPDGSTILHCAVTRGQMNKAKKYDSVENANGLEKIVRATVAAGGDIDMVDKDGRSALHLAAELGYPNKVRVLLEAGADHRLYDNDGKTAENLAKAARRRDVLPLFSVVRARNTILDMVAKAAGAAAKP